MILLDIKDRQKYGDYFKDCEDSCILSALAGMNGEMFCDSKENPRVFLINVADYSFIAGDSASENAKKILELADKIHESDFNIRCVNKEFEKVLEETYKDRYYTYSRFATYRSFENMDFEMLENKVKEAEKEYTLSLIDKNLFDYCKNNEWSEDFVIGYNNYEEWERNGMGVLFLKEGDPVSGASSYSAYPGGIEVEIITREDYRKKGLGFASGAALLIECKKRNLLASWDAAHEQSLRLAEKLGYKFMYEYKIYGIKKSGRN